MEPDSFDRVVKTRQPVVGSLAQGFGGQWLFPVRVPVVRDGKLKFVLAGLKFLKLGKVLTTGGTMALTIWVYAKMFGLAFAVGFVLLIFLHEMGHAAAMRLHGIAFGAPVFIPFVGAMIAMKNQPPNVRVEAEVAIAGPIAGGLAAAACWAAGVALGSPLLVALAYTGFFPGPLKALRPLEPLMAKLPVGAQYYTLAQA